jgi:hypothetical protein
MTRSEITASSCFDGPHYLRTIGVGEIWSARRQTTMAIPRGGAVGHCAWFAGLPRPRR